MIVKTELQKILEKKELLAKWEDYKPQKFESIDLEYWQGLKKKHKISR